MIDSESRRHLYVLVGCGYRGPGGIGTLLELFYSWQLVQVHENCETPIILYGDLWTPWSSGCDPSPEERPVRQSGHASYIQSSLRWKRSFGGSKNSIKTVRKWTMSAKIIVNRVELKRSKSEIRPWILGLRIERLNLPISNPSPRGPTW